MSLVDSIFQLAKANMLPPTEAKQQELALQQDCQPAHPYDPDDDVIYDDDVTDLATPPRHIAKARRQSVVPHQDHHGIDSFGSLGPLGSDYDAYDRLDQEYDNRLDQEHDRMLKQRLDQEFNQEFNRQFNQEINRQFNQEFDRWFYRELNPGYMCYPQEATSSVSPLDYVRDYARDWSGSRLEIDESVPMEVD